MLTRDKAKIEYISEGQPTPYELAFGVELDQNPHSKKMLKQKWFGLPSHQSDWLL